MGIIESLMQKRAATKETLLKLIKAVSFVFYIAGLLSFIFGFARMKYMNPLLPEDMGIQISLLLLWFVVLILIGLSLEFIGKFIFIEDMINKLKDRPEN